MPKLMMMSENVGELKYLEAISLAYRRCSDELERPWERV